MWNKIINVCNSIVGSKLNTEKSIKKRQWMTEEILERMEGQT